MICNRQVIGIHDCHLSKRLQLDSELTLEKAKKVICQHEAVTTGSAEHGQRSHSIDPSNSLTGYKPVMVPERMQRTPKEEGPYMRLARKHTNMPITLAN